jgi:hypothetical protein
METIIVERSFPAPVTMDEVQAAEDAVAWCLRQHQVRFLRSYFALDRRFMVCLYEAPDAEAVRATQRVAGLPVDLAWPGTLLLGGAIHVAPAGLATVTVQRVLPEPVTAEFVTEMYRRGDGCFGMHRVQPLATYLARDGRRLVCMFAAPDAEAVRVSNRQIGAPLARAFSCEVSLAPAPVTPGG